MAEKKQPLYTHEQDLGPGVMRTPGYEVEEPVHSGGFSDRRINNRGEPADHPTLSTYDGPQNGLQSGPDTNVPKPRMEVTEVKHADSPPSRVATPKESDK